MQDSIPPKFPCSELPSDPAAARLLGLYPQRQEGRWMQRVKILGGRLTGEQWGALARIVREHTPDTPLHLTTRQELELHNVTPDRVGLVQRTMADAGLTGLGSCGDTVRNVTVCPCAGLRAGSPDLAPLAWEVRRLLEATEGIYALPRKFKITFACSDGCGQPFINDLGFVAVRTNGSWGFRAVGAGSLGPRPATGIELLPRILPVEVLPLVRAAVRLFAAEGDRENRRTARLRHVRERMGDDAFRRRLGEEFERAWAEHPAPRVDLPEGEAGFAESVPLTFANGDVAPAAAEALGQLAGAAEVRVRIANDHRVLVFGSRAATLRERVAGHGALAEPASPRASIVACPGTRWCSRGIADTNALADRLRAAVGDRLPPEATVCISGCPNGCAHSAVADVGLFGGIATRDGEKLEVFDLWLGGGMGRDARPARLAARKLTPEEVVAAVGRGSAD